MFLRNPKLLFKSSSFRLITWYTVIFVLSSLAINFYAYTVISSFIFEQSRSEVEEDIAELEEIYTEQGLEALHTEVFEDVNDPFLVRLVDGAGHSALLRIPESWEGVTLPHLEKNYAFTENGWVSISGIGGEEEYEVRTLLLPGGEVLQMGQEPGERDALLARIRNVYLLAIIPIVLLAYLGGLFMADRALSPIRKLISTLDSIVENARVNVRVPEEQTDRLHDELVSLFNRMLDKIETLMGGMRNVLDNVAHDLRTPITRLRGAAETALQPGGDESILRDALAECIEESERIQIMLNTLMDVSEAETGAMRLNPQKLNVAPVLDEVVDLYSYVAEDKGVSVATDYPAEIFVLADRNRIRQVMANLLDNAVKYTPEGGSILISAVRNGEDVLITVKDTGIGISGSELDSIWDRLYRGDRSRSERGLGLGLSLVKAIVGAHRGRVEVSSAPGTGSEFSVHLPA